MTFAGGPFNNFVLQATAAMVDRLRGEPREVSLVTTVSGMLSKPGLAVWSGAPPASGGMLLADLADAAALATATRPTADPDHDPGPATVVSFTVTYGAEDPLAPTRTAIVADLADGSRVAATCDDASIARHALTESPIGQTVHCAGTTFTL
jgi:acetyl-CoA C-acetyltransferase